MRSASQPCSSVALGQSTSRILSGRPTTFALAASLTRGEQLLQWLQSIAAEFGVAVSQKDVWVSILEGVIFAALCLTLGVWAARRVGLLGRDVPATETLGVGLACGLVVVAAWWAAIWSGGRSAFTPVAIGFLAAILLSFGRGRRPAKDHGLVAVATVGSGLPQKWWSRNERLILTAVAGAGFVVAIGLLYGSTMAPGPRDGVQPVEFMDEAYYAVLGQNLAATGTETIYSTSGFSDIEGVPTQSWYHWGELWLASAAITVFGAAPLAARYFVVLSVLLLAAAALAGTVVCRIARTRSAKAYLLGLLFRLSISCANPVYPGPVLQLMGDWTHIRHIRFNTGLAAVAVLIGFYISRRLAVTGRDGSQLFSAERCGNDPAGSLVVGLLAAFAAFVLAMIRIVRACRLTGVCSPFQSPGGELLSPRERCSSPRWARVCSRAMASAVALLRRASHSSMSRGSSRWASRFSAPGSSSRYRWRGSRSRDGVGDIYSPQLRCWSPERSLGALDSRRFSTCSTCSSVA